MSWKATEWEFRNRAMLFGLIYAVSFWMYMFDHENSSDAIARALVRRWNAQVLQAAIDPADSAALLANGDSIARLLFLTASIVAVLAALTRTWASAYLEAGVVYASEVKSAGLVADGPYRWVRNPLYFGNVLMASGMGAMMSGSGSVFAFLATVAFSYRLIFREEAALAGTQGERYAAYRKTVPRLWPALLPRISRGRGAPRWAAGFAAEAWSWGFALAVVAFTITMRLAWFFGILAASIVLLWGLSSRIAKQQGPKGRENG